MINKSNHHIRIFNVSFNRLSKTLSAITMAVLLLTASGCSLFAPQHENILIDSDPQGAQVLLPGIRLTTPCSVSVPCDEDLTVTVKKDGYDTAVFNIERTLGKCGLLDVIGTWTIGVPVIGLFSPGAWTLKQHTIFAPLNKKPSDNATTN